MARKSSIALTVSAVALAQLYACTSSNNNSTTPPVNDSGVEPDAAPPVSDGAVTDTGPITDSTVPNEGGVAPSCESLPGTIVYIESGDTQEQLLKTYGRQLRDNANITIVFMLTGSCTLSPNLYNAVPIPATTSMFYIPSTAENSTWTPKDPESKCTITTAVPPDLGISALFPSSCAGLGALPTGIGEWNGPTQAYTFIVPSAEFTGGQTSISAEEAYYAFGFGANNPVLVSGAAEWNVPPQFFLRPATKSTLVATALNIELTPTQMTNVEADGGTADGRQLLPMSSQVLSGVAASTSMQAIGILGDEVYDANRSAGVNVLAFQDFGQTHAFFPDSTQTAFDKQNVRDGHYTLWSPTVYIAPATGAPLVPTNPAVQYIVYTILAIPGAPDAGTPIDGITITASVGVTPACAMQVQRSADGSPLLPFTPAAPCTCKFLSAIPGASASTLPASCTTCTTSATCAAGAIGCFNGYCETPPVPITDGGTDCDNTTITNACTNATAINKAGVVLPTTADGGLEPAPE